MCQFDEKYVGLHEQYFGLVMHILGIAAIYDQEMDFALLCWSCYVNFILSIHIKNEADCFIVFPYPSLNSSIQSNNHKENKILSQTEPNKNRGKH